MRCYTCNHVIEEKDGVLFHKLKFFDTLHKPNEPIVQGAIELPENEVINKAYDTVAEEVAKLAPTEKFGSNDDADPIEKMRIISEALKKYYGEDWLKIRNSKQPGLGK